MTKEDKQLLFKDLCARLPHHVYVKVWLKYGLTEEGFLDLEHNYSDVLQDAFYCNKIKKIKPYLRPMSSMTEDEEKEICQFMKDYNLLPGPDRAGVFCGEIVDWLNAHHFDYRNLIERGLAIDCTGLNVY